MNLKSHITMLSLMLISVAIGCKKEGPSKITPFPVTEVKFIDNKVIAHRGAWKKFNLPENSMAALKQAILLGCEGSEFDVHLTLDKVIVVNHDNTFGPYHIEKTLYTTLLNQPLSNGEKIPLLKDYLIEATKQTKTKLILEVKASQVAPARTIELTDSVVSLVKQLRAEKWMEYLSFDYRCLKRILELDQTARVFYLNGDLTPLQLGNDGINMDYNYNVYESNTDLIPQAKLNNVKVNVWTLHDSVRIKYFLNKNVDQITTDEPELMLQLIKQ